MLGGLSARRAHGRRLRSYRDGPMDAAVAEPRFPARSNESLEAQGYVLTAPLMRRPGSLSRRRQRRARRVISVSSSTPEADKSLSASPRPGRIWGPALAARDEEFGEPQPGGVGPPLGPGFARPARREIDLRRSSERPYSSGRQPVRRRGNAGRNEGQGEVRFAERESQGDGAINPPLPPPAPRETAKADGSGSPTLQADREPSIPSSRGSTPIRPTSATAPRPPRPRLRPVHRGERQTEGEHRSPGVVRIDEKGRPDRDALIFSALARLGFTQPGRKAF